MNMHSVRRSRRTVGGSGRTAANQSLSADQLRMLDFAIRWLPFGGGSPGDIFLEFGLSEKKFYDRLLTLITHRSVASGFEENLVESLIDVSTARLTRVTGRSLTA